MNRVGDDRHGLDGDLDVSYGEVVFGSCKLNMLLVTITSGPFKDIV